MTNLPAPNFGYAHPFWAEAIDLRKRGYSYAEISAVAGERGHALNYRQIALGLSKAPLNLDLPQVGSKWLRKKYEKIETDFSTMSTMRDLIQEALTKAGEAQDELDSDDGTMTSSRKIHLENTRDKWLKNAFEWSRDTATIEVEVGSVLAQAAERQERHKAVDGDVVKKAADQIMEEFNKKLPPANPEYLAKLYGGDNVVTDDELRKENAESEDE